MQQKNVVNTTFMAKNIDKKYKVEPGYNDIGLRNTSFIPSDILLYQLIPHS